METIFWLMWAADAVSGLVKFFGIIGGVGMFLAALFGLIAVVSSGDLAMEDFRLMTNKHIKWVLPLALSFLFIAAVMPAQRTLHLMVAAKAGELALDTRLGKKTIDAADAILDKIIKMAQEDKK